ncbi:hypothetical protein HQ865_01270 [Mucilaginibacter mali]|uniref:Uncharacterized protein n=1 Tax=Mucilaginibacter mali TaxID=2740462 RepID=A0A7D4Q679_9SPHI|nr:hypothetical protein [Mucilaginibacter mali]QKJ28445.1 hypothetical protein HQ865_01270 [Mucilaginibacter mali]
MTLKQAIQTLSEETQTAVNMVYEGHSVKSLMIGVQFMGDVNQAIAKATQICSGWTEIPDSLQFEHYVVLKNSDKIIPLTQFKEACY